MQLRLADVLEILRRHGVECNVSFQELLAYLEGPSYEDDATRLSDILNDKLVLHDVAEICFLKKMDYKIPQNVLMRAYPYTYQAHLEALNIELSEAENRGKYEWINRRCKDLASYLIYPKLPSNLESLVHRLISRYCDKTEYPNE